jgi:hypothetical protein
MDIINTYNIFIDSSQRVSGTTDNFNIELRKPLILTKPSNFFTCTIKDAEIPLVAQQINSKNNKLNFYITRGSVITPSFITLQAGNYNIVNLLDTLSSSLISKIFSLTSFTPKLAFTYNQSYLNATFSITGLDTTPTLITLKFSQNLNLGYMLGFTSDATFFYDASKVSTNISSTQNVNVNPMSSLMIRSTCLNQSQNWESLVEKSVVSDVLAKVQIVSLPNTWLFLKNGDLRITLTNKIIDVIDLYLSSNLDYQISLNGLNWSCCVVFDEIQVDNPEYSIHAGTAPSPEDEKQIHDLLQQKQDIINSLNKYKLRLGGTQKGSTEFSGLD